jgi:phage terminase large subunit-like protein
MTVAWSIKSPLPKNGDRDGPYIYDEGRAEAAVAWYPKFLKLPDGPKANYPFVLPPWQAKFTRAMEGWRHASTGRRRFQKGLIGVGRGNAKSSYVAGRGVKGVVGDGVPVPKVIVAGTDRENAGIIFGYQAAMVRKDKRLLRRLRVLDSTKRILRKPADGGLIRVISSDAQHAHGIHPTLLAIDDVQAQPSREFLGVLGTSQGTVEEPLALMCMTAGDDMDSVGWEEWEHGLKVLEDPALDEELLVDLYYLEPTDDWENPELWIKANPNLGISVYREFIAKQVKQAIERPRLRNEILQLHFNIWPRGEFASFILPELWAVNGGMIDLRQLARRECYVGIVATSSVDIACVAYYFPPTPGKQAEIVMDAFVPEDNIKRLEDSNKVSYRTWINEGWLTPTEGAVMDEEAIVKKIKERVNGKKFSVQDIGVNPRNAATLMRMLDEEGFTVTQTLPSFGNMSPAMTELERLVRAKEVIHSNNRLLSHGISGMQARKNSDGDVKPDFENSRGIISPAVAVFMGMSRQLASEVDSGEWAAS